MTAPTLGLLNCPEELLAEIFSYGAAGPADYRDAEIISPNNNRISASFRIASVCQRWRSIALSYARLWHYIAFPMLNEDDYNGDDSTTRPSYPPLERNILYAQLMLERSANAPIDIIFRFINGHANEGVTFEPLLNMLSEHRSRWRRFAVALSGAQVAAQVLDLLTGVALPTLRTIQISVQDNRYENTYEIYPRGRVETSMPAVPFLQYTPRLINVATINLPELWRRWQPVHSQHKLAVLEMLQEKLPDELWDMLVTQVELEWIMLGAETFDAKRFPRPPTEPIDLPNLEFVWLQQEAYKIFETYPRLLRTPKVHEVILDRVTFPPLARWLETLRPQVTALDLRNPPDFTSDDVAVIRMLNKLETLQLNGVERMSTSLLECLCERGDDASVKDDVLVMWPRLTALKLFGIYFDEDGAKLFGEFVRMRCQPASVDRKGMPRWAKLDFRLARSAEHRLDAAQVEEIERLGSTVDLD